MAKLLVLTDRPPEDSDWKGALTWRIILALAESHHEVLVATSVDLNEIVLTHPRLTVIRPVKSWRADQLPKLARVLLTYQPQVIHSFAFKKTKLWPSLTIWPYLHGMCALKPEMKRFSTLFDESDGASEDASFVWHQAADRVTVFTEQQKAAFAGRLKTEVVPLDLEFEELGVESSGQGRALIPAAVSEWEKPELALYHLAEFLLRHPETSVRIVGGWGTWLQSKRKMGWQILEEVAARVNMVAPLSFNELLSEVRASELLWLEPLPASSWKFLLCSQLAQRLDKKIFKASPLTLAFGSGSTANSISRLYSR